MTDIGMQGASTQEKIQGGALNPIRPLLPTPLVESWCLAANHVWRDQIFGPVVTLVACIWKQMQNASVRQTEDWIASLAPEKAAAVRDGSDFCAARRRLPLSIFTQAMKHVAQQAAAAQPQLLGNLPVWMLDGTTLRMPNTDSNAKHFGRSRNSVRESRSPVARLLLLVCAGCGAVLDMALSPYASSEAALFAQMLSRLPCSGVLVCDRAFSSFMVLWLVGQRGAHVLARHHATRRSRRIRRLARGDELHRWVRPRRSALGTERLQECSAEMDVRVITHEIKRPGYRTWTLKLATTLLDPKEYPASKLVELYLRRWDIELCLRTLKSDYGLAQLTAKSPDIAQKEICSTLLAFNCVVAKMALSGAPVRRLSHTRSRQLLLIYAERMALAATYRLPEIYRDMQMLIAQTTLPEQNRPPEPRSIVQRRSPYPVLMTTRAAWRRAHRVA